MARKEALTEHSVTIEHVEGYHCGEHEKQYVFVSDRPSEATYDYHLVSDGSLPAMYGIELETQNWGITRQTIYANVLRYICFQNFHKDLWKIERDGSLTGSDSSAECISQPMTKAYMRNHYKDFKAMWKFFSELGISCDETGKCGMHVHISNTCFGREQKTQDEAVRKLLYIVNKHYDLMVRLVYRNPNVTGYCPQMLDFTDKEYCKNHSLNSFDDDHYVCINMGHYREAENVELRLVGGQKSYACFRNTMECVFHLVEAVKRISWNDCDSIVKIFKGCNQYVFDRLSTYVFDAGLISNVELNSIRETIKTDNLL